MNLITGKINALQTLGTLDGPGVRFVAFMQGCPLRCACCHNPETWAVNGGTVYSPEALLKQVLRYRDYFGEKGGVTLSGGEPLLQPEFVTAFFTLCRQNGIHTCLDTSGCILNDKTAALLAVTDYCMLDIKYTDEEQYLRYVGCSMEAPLKFLDQLNLHSIPTRLRQVVIPTLNDSTESLQRLKNLAAQTPCVQEVELLPFEKLCLEKYEKLGLDFPLLNLPAADRQKVAELQKTVAICNKK